ncbi:MAG: type II toxin-antitoxin system VapC family toxin [Candidatus Micrarchaeota archaeon]
MKIFVDANIFLGALIPGNSTNGISSADLLDEIARGQHEALTSALVIDEVMWVLLKNNKPGIELCIRNIYELPNLEVRGVDASAPLIALEFMSNYSLKPRDAMHCAFMKQNNVNVIATNDPDFDKVKEIKRMKI